MKAIPLAVQNQKVVDRLDGANAPSLTKKVQHHTNVITPAVTVEQEQDTKQVRYTSTIRFYSFSILIIGIFL